LLVFFARMDSRCDMWLVVNIGCIECGVSSNVVGLFDNEGEADRIAGLLNTKHNWREGGQNSYEVFPLPLLGNITEEYLDVLKDDGV
jgi:hypothetical protein